MKLAFAGFLFCAAACARPPTDTTASGGTATVATATAPPAVRSFAGLMMELPAGRERGHADDALGLVQVTLADGAEVSIGWSPGELPDRGDADVTASMIAAELGADTGPAGEVDLSTSALPVQTHALVRGDQHGWFAMFACGPRTYSVAALGERARELEVRLLASVRCAVSAAAPPALDPPIIIDVPVTWRRVMTGPNGFTLSDGAELLFVSAAPVIDAAAIDHLTHAFASAPDGGLEAEQRVTARGAGGLRQVLHANRDGGAMVRAAAWGCADRARTLVIVDVIPPGGDVAAAERRVADARCVPNGAPVPDYRPDDRR